MAEQVAPGARYTSRAVSLPTGLAGTLRFRLVDDDNVANDPFYGPSAAGILEDPTGGGSYLFQSDVAGTAAPTTAGKYARLWDRGPGTALFADDDLLVSYTSAGGGGLPSGIDLCTLADVRLAMELSSDATELDSSIAERITEASEKLMAEWEREVAPATASATRRFTLEGRRVDLSPFDLRSATSVVLDPDGSALTLVANTDYKLQPIGARRWGVYTSLRLSNYLTTAAIEQRFDIVEVQVAGAWGFPSIPEIAKAACITTVRSWMEIAALRSAGVDGDVPVGPPSSSQTFALPAAARNISKQLYRYG